MITVLSTSISEAGNEKGNLSEIYHSDSSGGTELGLEQIDANSQNGESIFARLNHGGHLRFDYYTSSKQLDRNHSLPGITLQPRLLPKLNKWVDGKVEGRLTTQDLGDNREPVQGRLLEGYVNLYLGAVDIRLGKQIIAWGRADALNPTDNLTPRDFTVLSARDEEDRRTGTIGVRANYYAGPYTITFIWLPIFNPSVVPIGSPEGISVEEQKRNSGTASDQSFAIKLDRTGGVVDWSLSYYYGLDLMPVAMPVSPQRVNLLHNRLNVFGADFASTIGRYGVRGEIAYTHTQNYSGHDPIIKSPYAYAVLGVDTDITDDLNINLQFYERLIINWHDRSQISDPLLRSIATLNAIVNQQQDRYQSGLTSRLKATWLNKTLEGEILVAWNANRGDLFVRPSMNYAITDRLRAYAGWDIFTGSRDSFFGRLESMTSFFVELRLSF